jgi:tRNA(fMet)-specific endonuclease VapC
VVIFLPDTNAVSNFLRGASPALTARMHAEFSSLRLSALVVAEREFGILHHASGLRFRREFEALVASLPVEPLTREDAAHYARLRSTLEKRGRGIGPIDTLIAAQALRLGATVVTHNVREFSRVPGLHYEDWQAE